MAFQFTGLSFDRGLEFLHLFPDPWRKADRRLDAQRSLGLCCRMLINLLEIPQEGKTFICDNKTTEFNEVLADLIQKTPYKTEFEIRPLELGTFELKGFIKTEMVEQCSRCGIDFNFKVDEAFKELLMPELDQPRNSKYAKANHYSDMHSEGLSVAEYQGHHFNMGEYLHEVIGLSAPYNPCPAVTVAGDCTVCHENVQEKNFSYEEGFEKKPESPFSVLQVLKSQENKKT